MKKILSKYNINSELSKIVVLEETEDGVTFLADDGTEKWIGYANVQEVKRIKINENIVSNIYTVFAKGKIRW